MDYINEFYQMVNKLNELSLNLEKKAIDNNDLYYYKGLYFYEYTNQAFAYLEPLIKYDSYLDELQSKEWEEEVFDSQVNKKQTQLSHEQIDEIVETFMNGLEAEGYKIVESNYAKRSEMKENRRDSVYAPLDIDEDNSLEYELQVEYKDEIYVYYLIVDLDSNAIKVFSHYGYDEDDEKNEVKNRLENQELSDYGDALISRWTTDTRYLIEREPYISKEDKDRYYIDYYEQDNIYRSSSPIISVILYYDGQIRRITIEKIERLLKSYNIANDGIYKINQDLTRLEGHLPSQIEEMMQKVSIVETSNNEILYEIEVKYGETRLFYYIDYYTFEYQHVNDKRIY